MFLHSSSGFLFHSYKSWHFLCSSDKVLYQVWPLVLKPEAPVGIFSPSASLCCSFWWKCEKITWSFITLDYIFRHSQVNECFHARRKFLFWCSSKEYAIGVEILSHLQWFPTKQGCCRAPGVIFTLQSRSFFFFSSSPRAADTVSQPLLSLLPSL